MQIENKQVLNLVAQVDNHIKAASTLGFIFPDQNAIYESVRGFPDYSLEGLRRNEARARELALQASSLRKSETVSSYDQLALDMLDHFLCYGNYIIDNPVNEEFYYLKFDVTPYTFPLNMFWNTLPSFPFATKEQVERHMELMRDYPRFTAQFLEKLQDQAKRGIYLSAYAIDGALNTLRAYAVAPEKHPATMQREGSAATRKQMETEFAWFESGRQNLLDAAAYLDSSQYRAKAPQNIGLSHYEDGTEFYSYLRRFHLNDSVCAGALHELGKEQLEAAYLKQADIRTKLGFSGGHKAFMESLKGNPRFYPPSPEQLETLLNDCLHKISTALPRFFPRLPKAPYRAERLPLELEGSMTFGYFEIPTPEKPVGTYYFNASGLEDKCQITAASIMAHELIPGHHLQVALVQESETLHPLFKKHTGTCYCEGWAEYAAIFSNEQGLFEDAYDEYGRLEMEKFICTRLIVDTGLNELDWSLEDGIAFMLENTFCSEAMARSEVIRYGTDIPGQCLPYKYGSIKFLELRDLYRAAKGKNYNPRDFHALVLEPGAVPMDALRRYIEREIST